MRKKIKTAEDLLTAIARLVGELIIQSALSKTDTFGTGTRCPSQRDVRLIDSQIAGAKKAWDQL